MLTAAAWQEMAGITTYAFLIMLAVGVVMSAIEWALPQRWKRRALKDRFRP